MALKFFWRCDGESFDPTHDFSAGVTSYGTAGSGTAAIQGTTVKHGAGALAAADRAFLWDDGGLNVILNPLGFAVGFWYRSSVWSNTGQLFRSQGSTGYSQCFAVETQGSPDINSARVRLRVLEDSEGWTNLVTPTDAVLRHDTWYFIVAAVDINTNRRLLRVYNEAGDVIRDETSTATLTAPTNLATFRFGQMGGGAAVLDNLFLADSYDDWEAIVANRDITSWTSFSAGSLPIISSVNDTTLVNGQTGVVITGTDFGASQGNVYISPVDDFASAAKVTQTVTAWGDTSITFTAKQLGLVTNAQCYLFVQTSGAANNAAGSPLKFVFRSGRTTPATGLRAQTATMSGS